MGNSAMSMLAPGNWPAFVLISARLSGLFLLSPFWSMMTIPKSVKGAVVVVLAAAMVPGSPKPPFQDQIVTIPIPLMLEFTIGVAIGLVASVVSHALLIASEVVSLQTGLSLGQAISPNIDLGGPAIGQFNGLLGLAVFVSIGGPVQMIDAVGRSLAQYPPGTTMMLNDGGAGLLKVTGSIFAYAVQIAAPVMVALTVTNLAMAILSRAVPQLNAMDMSFAITVGVGMIMIGLSLPVMVRILGRWLSAVPGSADSLLQTMLRAGAN
jgi:flagellar biosynthetic protein FliR